MSKPNSSTLDSQTMQNIIEAAFERRIEITPKNAGSELIAVINTVISGLDDGTLRIAEQVTVDMRCDAAGPVETNWVTHQWIKMAVLLSFRTNKNRVICGGELLYYDKVELKFHAGLPVDYFENAGIRVVPPAVVRRGVFIGKNVVLMPSYVNIGAHVDDGTMVDNWVTVGSCAQIGKNVHLSANVLIGGVLEPMQDNPTIIEDNCFIGAGSQVVEGVIVREYAVLSMGVLIGKNTPIVDRTNNNSIIYGVVPPRAVVMMGIHPTKGLICPQIVKYRDEQTDAATALNEMLRGI